MNDAVNRFYNSVAGAATQSQSALIELFVYFLTVESGQEAATPQQVASCFEACDLSIPGNVSARLSEGLKTKPQKYIKTKSGYKLQRHMREALSKKLGAETMTAQTSATLRGLEHKLPAGADKEFLKEAINCFEVGANRAAIVMTWILAMDHLFAFIIAHKLADFNAALAKDKGVKISAVSQRDDFNEIKENKFIELCRAAGIISNDVRKILDQKLGTRNSCAHPSGVTVNKSKTIDFIEDLIDNVVLKFSI
jgi:predicted peroxiredoxin